MDRTTGRHPSQVQGQALPCTSFPCYHHPDRSFKNYLNRPAAIFILMEINRSEWAAPSFIIPEKGGRFIFISDFRQLNKQCKRTPYPLPRIKYMLNNISSFTYATTLYLIIVYYNISLTDASKKVCTITT